MAPASLHPSEVKSICNALEVSPSCHAPSSPVSVPDKGVGKHSAGTGRKSGAEEKESTFHGAKKKK